MVDLAEVAILEFVKDLRSSGLRHVAIERRLRDDDGAGRFAWTIKGERHRGTRRTCSILMPGVFLSRVRFLDWSPPGAVALFLDARPHLWPDAVYWAGEKLR